MALGYVVFEGVNEGPVRGLYRTQALANAVATGSPYTAHIGAVEMGNFTPRDAYFNGAGLVNLPEPPPMPAGPTRPYSR